MSAVLKKKRKASLTLLGSTGAKNKFNKLRNRIQFLFVLSSVRLFQGAIPMTQVTL
jgi:hypothetical protein